MFTATTPAGTRVCVDAIDGASPGGELAALALWFDVGSADEPPGLHGAAHLLEHMLFKGAGDLGVGQAAARIEAMGGDLNAWTSFEETCLHATVPARHAEEALGVLATMALSPAIDAAELELERKVVVEEIRGGRDDLDLVLDEALYALAWAGDAYGRPIIGTERSVRGISSDSLAGFHARHYVASNLCLAVAGAVDAEAIARAAERLFPPGPPAPSRALSPARPGPPGRARVAPRFGARIATLAFPAPGHGHPDLPALDVLVTLLGGGGGSMLEQQVRLPGHAKSASAHLELERRGGLVVVELEAARGDVRRAVHAAQSVLSAAAAGSIERGAVARARTQLRAGRSFSRQYAESRAHSAAFGQAVMGDPEAWRGYDAGIAAVEVADVARVAAAALDARRGYEVAVDVALGRARAWPAPPRAAAPPPVRRVTLENGLRVLLEPDRGEILSLRAVAAGGLLGERPAWSGRAAAWARVVTRATETRGLGQVATAMESLGGHLGALAGRNTQAVRADLPSDRGMEGLELFLDALAAPTFPAEEVARAREELVEAIEQLDDDPGRRLLEATWAAACPAHPWSLPIGGTRAGLGRVRTAALAELHAQWRGAEGLVLAVAGAMDADQVIARIRERLGTLPPREWRPAKAAPRFPRRARRVEVRSAREQAIVAMAFCGGGAREPTSPALDVLAAVLNGQAGRLFMELREAHGLAYAVGASVEDGIFPGLVTVSLATEPGRVDEAERRMAAVLERIAAGAIEAAEVERAKATLGGAVATELQSCAARAAEAAGQELLGLDGTRYRAAMHRFEAVSAEATRALAARVLSQPVVIARLVPARARGRRSG